VSGQQGSQRKGNAEGRLDLAVLFVGEVQLVLDALGGLVDRQPVHVVDDGGQQQQAAHPPLPGGAAGRRNGLGRGWGQSGGAAWGALLHGSRRGRFGQASQIKEISSTVLPVSRWASVNTSGLKKCKRW